MYAWDTDMREDAKLAASLGFIYRHHPTTQDAAIGILADGRTTFAFPGAPPARDLWEVRSRIVSQLRARSRGSSRTCSPARPSRTATRRAWSIATAATCGWSRAS